MVSDLNLTVLPSLPLPHFPAFVSFSTSTNYPKWRYHTSTGSGRVEILRGITTNNVNWIKTLLYFIIIMKPATEIFHF